MEFDQGLKRGFVVSSRAQNLRRQVDEVREVQQPSLRRAAKDAMTKRPLMRV